MIIGNFLKNNLKALGIGLILNSAIHGMEEKEETSVPSTISEPVIYANFKDFEGFEGANDNLLLQYIEKCMPQLNKEETLRASVVLKMLIMLGRTPIYDDNNIESLCIKEIKLTYKEEEVGFNFPPILDIQGPYLSQCKPGKYILDVGAGDGYDSIMARLAGANVISVDIFQKQLDYLKNRADKIFKTLNQSHQPFEKLPQYEMHTLKNDFSKVNSVPTDFFGKFQIINANKIMHFLDEKETSNFIDNAHSMLADEGLIFITNLTPKTEHKHQREGVCYIKQIQILNENDEILEDSKIKIKRKESLIKNFGGIKGLCEVVLPNKEKHVYYAKHFHTYFTLSTYLSTKFEIIDYTPVNPNTEESFISIIAQKRSV